MVDISSPATSAVDEPLPDESCSGGLRGAPALLLAGSEDEESTEPHICRGID